jgi:HJR/Mrr/RecB family endonuclease
MPSRKFEELIAGLFEGFGYEVELTAQTRDGGYDIVAVRRAEMTTRSLIECKRYSSDNKVGVGVVRQLRGVVTSSDATNGIVATTATFTRDAQRFIGENKWLMKGEALAELSSGSTAISDDHLRSKA